MSAPILTKKQQKKSLSAIKNRKKVQKNILAAPDIFTIRKPVFNESYMPKIYETMEQLLPGVKLPQDKVFKKSKIVSTSEESAKTSVEARLKRNQLFLGINSVSRGVSNELVACVLFANDVKPKLLISHLIVLCSFKNIPYLYMENLRDLTKRTLGFSCVALGIRKDSTFFLPLINSIMCAVEGQNYNSVVELPLNDSEMSILNVIDENTKINENSKNSFSYLLRNSKTKREFYPDQDMANLEKNKSENYISFRADDEVSIRFPRPLTKEKIKGNNSIVNNDVTTQNQRNSVINNKEPDFIVGYSATEILKMEANPNRKKKKFMKFRKGK